MSHPRWPGFNTKTGNPVYDNISSRLNKRLYREMRKTFKVHAVGRKRKKHLLRVEGGKYIVLWNQMRNDLIKERKAAREATR